MIKIVLLLALLLCQSAFLQAGEFRFRIQEDLGHLDWNQGEVPPLVVMQLMEGLTSTDHQGKAKPGLAHSWTQLTKTSQGGPGWIFHIRKEAKWSDGKPVCAQDFINSWTRVLSPQLSSPYAHYLFFLKNAETFHKGKLPANSLGLIAKGCQDLEVTLQDAVGYFPQITSHWVTFPIRQDLIDKHPQQWYLPENLVVTGPYVLKEWKRDQSFTLAQNPRYWNHTSVQQPHLKALVIADDQTALNLFRSGQLHWMKDLPLQERKKLSTEKGYRSDPSLVGYYLGFNVTMPPFDNVNLRCSLASALEKIQIPQILEGGEIPANSWVPPVLSTIKHSSEKALFNATAAKKLLSMVSPLPALALEYYIKDIHTPVMQWVQAQWTKHLGLKIELHPQEGKTYWSHLATNPPGLFLSGTTAWFSHPYAFLSELSAGSHANWGHYNSKQFNEVIDKIKLQPRVDPALLAKAEDQLLRKDCAIIPLYFRSTLSLTSPQCTAAVINPLTYVYFKDVHCKNLR